jgi:hypothetical protein
MTNAILRLKSKIAAAKRRYLLSSLLVRYYWRHTKQGIASALRRLRPGSTQR